MTSIARKPDEIRAMIEAAGQVALPVGDQVIVMPKDQAFRILDHFEQRSDFRLVCARCPEDEIPFLVLEMPRNLQ